jgi:muramoyltetrapeptide carboxypeptidase
LRPDLKPRALRAGERIAIVAPASPFARDEFELGVLELAQLGFQPVYSEDVFARAEYLAGSPALRAADFRAAWTDPTIAAVVAARGGYGSVHLLPLLDAAEIRQHAKVFIGYSDNTSLLTWLNQACGMVAFHGPMVEGRFARGPEGYDRESFMRAVTRTEPLGDVPVDGVESLRDGEAQGLLVGGTLTQLVASLGTPFAFDPEPGCVLFLDEIAERPYRLDRMLTQLRLSGILGRASAIVFNALPRCDEAGGSPTARDTVRLVLEGFPGPVLYGLRSGHTDGPSLTLPFGVSARVQAGPQPSLIIEEAAVR